jgi:hypothetical protein
VIGVSLFTERLCFLDLLAAASSHIACTKAVGSIGDRTLKKTTEQDPSVHMLEQEYHVAKVKGVTYDMECPIGLRRRVPGLTQAPSSSPIPSGTRRPRLQNLLRQQARMNPQQPSFEDTAFLHTVYINLWRIKQGYFGVSLRHTSSNKSLSSITHLASFPLLHVAHMPASPGSICFLVGGASPL